MIGERLGPYRIEEELGSGGMGTVYRAVVGEGSRRLEPGRSVALKVVHPHLLGKAGFFKRFLREAEIGRRVDHENVVRTYDADAGEAGGQAVHYLVMEYVQGQTLRDLLVEIGRVPEALLREIALQVTNGLAAIHAAGIVHRDLKPENILLTGRHEVRLMDLGVARLVDESIALTREGQFAGSVLYAAPEQFGRGAIGPRADLYALGVVLYELAAGFNPFRRDAAAAVVGAHLEMKPEPLLDRDVDTSPFLSEVVRTLLAKHPEDRFTSADELRAVLTEAESSAWWAEREGRLLRERARRPRLRVSRTTEVFGRDMEHLALREEFEKVRAGAGRAVLMLGEPGIGKTRLIDAFVREVEEEHPETAVLYGSYPPYGGLGGISDGILEYFGSTHLESSLRPFLETTPTLVAAFAAILRRDATPAAAEPVQGDALNTVMVHLMRGIAAERPLIWIIDDLHYAEPESRGVALSLARAVEGHRVLLLVTSRPGLPEDEVSHFTCLDTCRRLDLQRLSPRQVVLLLRDALGSEVLADRLGARIAYKSDGIPFFIFEILRGLEESGLLQKHDDGSYIETTEIEEIAVPSAVRDLVEARLKDLDPDLRAILDVGAVEGFEFDPALVCRVLDRPRLPVLQSLAELTRRSGIIRPAGSRYQFDHHQIEEVLLRALPEGLREEYHALLAEAFQAAHDEVDAEAAVFLARHHLFGSRPVQGLDHLDRALAHLRQGYRNGTYLSLVARALAREGLVRGARRVELLLGQALLLGLVGRRVEEGAALEEALHLAADEGADVLRARVHEQLGGHLRILGRIEDATRHYEDALSLARETGEAELEAQIIGGLGNVHASCGVYDEALPLLERRIELGRALGEDATLTHAYGNLAAVLFSMGETARGIQLMEENLARAERTGDLWDEVHTRGNLGMAYETRGRVDEAREHLERSRTLARQIGDRDGEAYAESSLGTLHDAAGRLEDARAHYTRALALHREVGNRIGEGISDGNLGNMALSLGRFTEALDRYERALEIAREVKDLHIVCACLSAQAHAYAWLGDPESAREKARQSIEAGRTSGAPGNEAYAYYALGTVEEIAGCFDEALEHTDRAADLLGETTRDELTADVMLQRGCILQAMRDLDGARDCFEDAARRVRAPVRPRILVESVCRLARLPGGDPARAERVYADHGRGLSVRNEMKTRYLLWRLTGSEENLAEASAILTRLIEGAPSAYRTSMVRNVPLHRAIHDAASAGDGAGRPPAG